MGVSLGDLFNFETVSPYVALADLKFGMEHKLVSNSGSFFLSLWDAETTGMSYHAQLLG